MRAISAAIRGRSSSQAPPPRDAANALQLERTLLGDQDHGHHLAALLVDLQLQLHRFHRSHQQAAEVDALTLLDVHLRDVEGPAGGLLAARLLGVSLLDLLGVLRG